MAMTTGWCGGEGDREGLDEIGDGGSSEGGWKRPPLRRLALPDAIGRGARDRPGVCGGAVADGRCGVSEIAVLHDGRVAVRVVRVGTQGSLNRPSTSAPNE